MISSYFSCSFVILIFIKCHIDNNWHCAFDASIGRNLFVNVRTGHSSFEHPSRLDTLGNDIAIVN